MKQAIRSTLATMALVFCALTGTAYAAQGGEGNNPGCNGVGNVNSTCEGGDGPVFEAPTYNGGSAASASNAVGVGVGVGIGAALSGSSADVSSTNQNQNTNQSSNMNTVLNSASTGDSAASVSITNNAAKAPRSVKVKSTPDVNAPALASGGDDICMGSSSAGAGVAGAGISIGSTWTDENCNRRKNATLLANMGHKVTANFLLCEDEAIRKAFAASGEVECPVKEQDPAEEATALYK